jgi:uncharacterized protein
MKRYPLFRFFLLWLLIWGFASRTFSASFDCAKASSTVETLVCKDSETSTLDDKLQQAYKIALTAVAPFNKPELVKEQRDWIRYTRNICQDTACLKQAYAARTEVLARNEKYIVDRSSCELPSGNTACVNVVTYRDPSVRIDSFNQSLAEQKKSGKIIGCSRLINLPVGYANSNNSFGGVCTLQDGAQRTSVEICNDDMVGHFQMRSAAPQEVSDKSLVDFTNDNCFGG